MLMAAAHALAEHRSPALGDPTARLLPPLAELRRVTKAIAVAVGKEAQRAGVAPPPPKRNCAGSSAGRDLRQLDAGNKSCTIIEYRQWIRDEIHNVW